MRRWIKSDIFGWENKTHCSVGKPAAVGFLIYGD